MLLSWLISYLSIGVAFGNETWKIKLKQNSSFDLVFRELVVIISSTIGHCIAPSVCSLLLVLLCHTWNMIWIRCKSSTSRRFCASCSVVFWRSLNLMNMNYSKIVSISFVAPYYFLVYNYLSYFILLITKCNDKLSMYYLFNLYRFFRTMKIY